jgi:hypothetical protein
MLLEATYRALHDAIPENAGFLRPGAALAVLIATDEDDCSADPGSDVFSGPYGPVSLFSRCPASLTRSSRFAPRSHLAGVAGAPGPGARSGGSRATRIAHAPGSSRRCRFT